MSVESASALPGKRMTMRPVASLIALAVAERFSEVTPVDPPMRTASDPAASIFLAISAAFSGDCLSGSMRAICNVPLSAIISRRFCITVMQSRHISRRPGQWSPRHRYCPSSMLALYKNIASERPEPLSL